MFFENLKSMGVFGFHWHIFYHLCYNLFYRLMRKATLPKGTIVPNHIAVILDGNGRWARSRGLRVTKGHEEGAKAISKILKASRGFGVHTLTIWGFSTENWKRPPAERARIFALVKNTLEREIAMAMKEGVRIYHIGRKDRLPAPLLGALKKAEEETKGNSNYILNIALDYGGQDEILRAVRKIVRNGVTENKIDEKLFASYLDTAGQPYPNPDLFIRTSGEQRTSGLMPWQLAYAEFYFEEDHLPDMTPEKLVRAICDYSRRRRRFGGKDKLSHFKFKPEVVAQLELNWWRLGNVPEGTRLRDYAVSHLKEQWGISSKLAKEAAKYMVEATIERDNKKWKRAGVSLGKFYKLIKEEVKLAFEPSLAASLQIKLWQDAREESARRYISEVYRISDFQAAKAAHLRTLADAERRLALAKGGELHWQKAQKYLRMYYKALKDRVA